MNDQVLWQLGGWTMIHFLWIGAFATLVLAIVRLLLRRASANLRYATTLVCFLALAVTPLAIAALLAKDVDWTATTTQAEVVDLLPKQVVSEPALAPAGVAMQRPMVIDLADTPIDVDARLAAPSNSEPAGPSDVNPLAAAAPELSELPIEATNDAMAAALSQVPTYLPWVWIVGTPLMFLLLGTGLIGSDRIRRGAQVLTNGPVYETTRRLRTALRLGRNVAVGVSDRVLQPVLVGIVRPMILLPPAALTGWSPEELEMALLHELAHVRRHDNLVNVLQRFVESLLFFHPCVWLVSRWLRVDREQCCDAIVVRQTGAREAYADLLISVARDASSRRLPSTAVALSSHPLARRVRRILQLEDEEMLVSKRSMGLVAVVLVAFVALAMWHGQPASVAQDASGEPEAPATEDIETAELTTEGTEPSLSPDLKPHSIDDVEIDFDGPQRIYELTGDEHHEQVFAVAKAHQEAGHKVMIQSRRGGGRLVVTKPEPALPATVAAPTANLPFLPLEEQRVADLAFKMLSVEVAPLDPETLKSVKENGFDGGVRIEDVGKVVYARGSKISRQPQDERDWRAGDILVGLHVWETPNLPALGKVLRRDDLDEFNPIKYFVLREEVDAEALRKLEREQERRRGGGGGFGGEFSGDFESGGGFGMESDEWEQGARMAGGEFGGRGGGFGEFGGGGFGRRSSRDRVGANREPPTKLVLVTGRMSFDQRAWEFEQVRLKRVEQNRPGAGRSYRNADIDQSPLPKMESGGRPTASQNDRKIRDQNARIADDMIKELASVQAARDQLVNAYERFIDQAASKLTAEESKLEAASAKLSKAKAELKRRKDLVEEGLEPHLKLQASEQEYREAVAQVRTAEHDVLAARNALEAKKRERDSKQAEWTAKINKLQVELQKARVDALRAEIAAEKNPVRGSKRVDNDRPPKAEPADKSASRVYPLIYPLMGPATDEELRAYIAASQDGKSGTLLRDTTSNNPEATHGMVWVADAPSAEQLKPTLLYDGRTFDQWKEDWKTELKTENRIEAIEALRAFGRAGLGKQATEAILEVAEPYQFNVWGDSDGEKGLVTAIVHAFGGSDGNPPVPAKASLPILVERLKQHPKHYKWLVWHALTGVKPTDDELSPLLAQLAAEGDSDLREMGLYALLRIDPDIELQETRNSVTKNLTDDDTSVAMAAASGLVKSDQRGFRGGGGVQSTVTLRSLMPELLPQLFHDEFNIRKNARRVLSYGSDMQIGDLENALIHVVESPTEPLRVGDTMLFDEGSSPEELKARKLAAIRTLAVLGSKARTAVPLLDKLLTDEDSELRMAAYVARNEVLGLRHEENTSWYKLDKNVLKVFGLVNEDDEYDSSPLLRLERERKAEVEMLGRTMYTGGGGGFGGGGVF